MKNVTVAMDVPANTRGTRIDFPREALTGRRSTDVACLVGLTAVLAFWGLNAGPGLSDHEAIVALGASHIRETGEWLVPKVGPETFIRKPPLAFWTAALSSFVVDPPTRAPSVSETASRFPSALAAILTVITIYGLGRSMFGHEIGILAGLVMASCAGAMLFSHTPKSKCNSLS